MVIKELQINHFRLKAKTTKFNNSVILRCIADITMKTKIY